MGGSEGKKEITGKTERVKRITGNKQIDRK